MTSTDLYTMPVRDYSSASIPLGDNVKEAKIIKLSQETFKRGKKQFRLSGNFQVAKKEETPIVKKVEFSQLSELEKKSIENKASKMGKMVHFPVNDILNAREIAPAKPAKLGATFIEKVHTNKQLIKQVLSMKNDMDIQKESKDTLVSTNSTAKEEVVVKFDPEEIKHRVNQSFEQANSVPVKEYTIDISTEDDEVQPIRLPHAERNAKLHIPSTEEEKAIGLKEYIDKENGIDMFDANSTDKDLSISADDFSFEDVTQDDITRAVYMDDGIEEDVNQLLEEKRRQKEILEALEQARLENENSLKEYKTKKAKEETKIEEEKRIENEAKSVEEQKQKVLKSYETTYDATKKQLQAERTRIMNETKNYQKAYQNEIEKANRIWTQTVETEENISEIDARIPGIMQQIQSNRSEIDSIMDRTQHIREMAKDITGNDVKVDSSMKFRSVDTNSFDSIFDGVSPVDSFTEQKKNSYSKGKKAA